jgi:hypothetical protein
MEHQTESYLFAKSMIAQSSLPIKDLSEEELRPLTLILSMTISKSGWKLESLKGMLTDSRLIYISAQLLVISLCVNLNKEMQKQGLDGVNYLENVRQLESRILCLKETLIKRIHRHIKIMD